MPLANVFWLLPALVGSALLSWVFCALAQSLNVVDAPDGIRKHQAVAVPRLGGAGMALTVIVMAAGSAALGVIPADVLQPMLPALAFAFCVALIGLWDDLTEANALIKLIIMAALAVGVAVYGLRIDSLTTPFGPVTMPAIMIAGSALWLVVMTNATNFMDGANGIAFGSLAIMFAGLGVAQFFDTGNAHQAVIIISCGAILGFLVHNLQGTLYAGDVGSLGFGALFAALGLASDLSAWTLATLALPFLVDVLLTLVWRARHGRPLMSAHRDHAYQRMMDYRWSHLDVAVFWWGLSGACAAAAVIGMLGGGALPQVLFWILTLVISGLWSLVPRESR